MKNKMKHTVESVENDLRNEFEKLGSTKWNVFGDVNMREYGGIRYRRCKVIDMIEIQFYHGIDDIPEGMPDYLETNIDLEDLLCCIEDIWSFSDVGNCGLDIGSAISCRNAYDGFLNKMHGWKFSK